MATPSSKHYNPGPTASPPQASTSAPATRPLSYKSPSTKTPSTSGGAAQQQQQQQSQKSGSGSQQYATAATPLATGAIDDPIAFGSPSALLALGGYSGITPSPAAAGHEGLDLHDLGMMNGLKIQSFVPSRSRRWSNSRIPP